MKTVLVMMSTYNGEKYIRTQIDSILSQQDVAVSLLIRDDGSTDTTTDILKEYGKLENVFLEYGENIGYARSFWSLLLKNNEYDYYAFSDQDDYWMPRKLISGIEKLQNSSNRLKLYASTLEVVDENLQHMYYHDYKNLKISLGSAIVRQRLAGCTMIFSNELKHLVEKIDIRDSETKIDHDTVTYFLCLALGGEVIFDSNTYIKYRRHSGNVTSKGKNIIKRVSPYFNIFNVDKNRKYGEIKYLYPYYKDLFLESNKLLLEQILKYKDNYWNTLLLATNKELNCNIWQLNAIVKLAILLRCL